MAAGLLRSGLDSLGINGVMLISDIGSMSRKRCIDVTKAEIGEHRLSVSSNGLSG